MNSFSTLPEPGPSHGDLLADRLTRLDVDVRDQPVQAQAHHHTTSLPPPKTPHDGYGYGFRPLSGMSSPLIPPDRNSPLPDVNGLGWPGQSTFSSHPLRPPAFRSPPSSFSKSNKQSPPSLASTHPPKRKNLARLDSPPPSAPSSNASARIPIEKVSFARQNAMPRP